MQTKNRFLSLSAFSLLLLTTACVKPVVDAVDNTIEFSTHADDQSLISGDMEAIANDANDAIESYPSMNGRTMQVQSICNATVTADTTSNPRKITITYNGANCYGNRTRTGVVLVTMPSGMHWSDPGAVLTITYQNLKITRILDGKSITINGVKTITNVNGGKVVQVATSNPVTHLIQSNNMHLTFDSGMHRTWNIARKRVFSYSNGLVMTVTGAHTNGTNTQISEWGSNRFGHSFVTSITQPMVVRQDCAFRLTSGQVKHERSGNIATATFGLDSSGNPTGCPANGSYYFKLTWNGIGGNMQSVVLPY